MASLPEKPVPHVVTDDEADEQQMLPYDQNLAKLREQKEPAGYKLGETPCDENLVDDDIIEEGHHTT